MSLTSRKKYIGQVVSLLRKKHGKGNAAFIFGISGQWGEGKTHFIDSVANSMELGGQYKCIKVNPWKYNNDKTSFMRALLYELRQSLGVSLKLESLKYDQTKVHLNWRRFMLAILPIVVSLIIVFSLGEGYLYPQVLRFSDTYPDAYQNIQRLYPLIVILLSALFLPLLLSLISVTKSESKAETLDAFDESLKAIINRSKYKIIIIVDDLDRVTPEVARIVLDNLRTFFDNPKLTFIVAGDHSYIERHLGETLLSPDEPDQGKKPEEGRRFLKKIFDVYWRLPLPTESEVIKYIETKITKDDTPNILKFLHIEKNLNQFKGLLLKYFYKNIRAILRFIDQVEYTFETVNILEKEGHIDKKHIEDFKSYPLLIVKILLIQDLGNPLYERMLKESFILKNHEYMMSERADKAEVVNKTFEGILLSENQKVTLTKLFIEEDLPFHTKAAGFLVSNVSVFLHLFADPDSPDIKGHEPVDFIHEMEVSRSANDIEILLTSQGEGNISQIPEVVVTYINALLDKDINSETFPMSFKRWFKDLIKALINIRYGNPYLKLHLGFMKAFKDIRLDLLANSNYSLGPTDQDPNVYNSTSDKLELSKDILEWLSKFDYGPNKSYLSAILDQINLIVPLDIQSIDAQLFVPGQSRKEKVYKVFLAKIINKFFTTGLSLLSNVSSTAENVSDELKLEFRNSDTNARVDYVVSNIGTDTVYLLSELILLYGSDREKNELKNRVFDGANVHRNEVYWDYALHPQIIKNANWNREDLELNLVEQAKVVENPLLSNYFRYMLSRISDPDALFRSFSTTEGFWSQHDIYGNFEFSNLAPSTEVASKFFKDTISLIIKRVRAGQAVDDYIRMLGSDRWIYKNIPPSGRRKLIFIPLENLINKLANEALIANAIQSVIDDWNMLENS